MVVVGGHRFPFRFRFHFHFWASNACASYSYIRSDPIQPQPVEDEGSIFMPTAHCSDSEKNNNGNGNGNSDSNEQIGDVEMKRWRENSLFPCDIIVCNSSPQPPMMFSSTGLEKLRVRSADQHLFSLPCFLVELVELVSIIDYCLNDSWLDWISYYHITDYCILINIVDSTSIW